MREMMSGEGFEPVMLAQAIRIPIQQSESSGRGIVASTCKTSNTGCHAGCVLQPIRHPRTSTAAKKRASAADCNCKCTGRRSTQHVDHLAQSLPVVAHHI